MSAHQRKYDPADSSPCSSCRDFLPLDFSKNNPRTFLPDFQRTARDGCFRCQFLLAGIEKFSYFWKSSSESAGQAASTTAQETWREDEIRVFNYAYDADVLEVLLSRPRRAEEGYETLELEFYSHKDEESPFPEFFPAGDVPQSSNSEASFATIQGWISTCLSSHKLCSSGKELSIMPTRILDVGVPDATNQRLCLESEVAVPAQYAALSHAWGRKEDRIKPMPKTLKSNICQRLEGIDWSELTRTFQDAIKITRRLGLRYLWVDALSIIQDDDDDWALEASRMASVYENAYVVIAATRSRTGDDGCFSERSCSYKVSLADSAGKVFNAYVKQKISHRDFAEGPATFETMPLFDRAWVFQERLLATRVIHYTQHEIMWECKESLKCECQGMESGRDWSHGKNTGNFKLKQAQVLYHNDNALERLKQWSRILREYSVRSLHFDGDRLPALSGIAGQMRLPSMGQYLAGIWSESMPQTLTWKTSVGIVEKRWLTRRPVEYRGPSWSWVSVEAECLMWVPDPADEVEVHCIVEEAQCKLVSPDLYGQVSSGVLTVSAPSFWTKLRYTELRDQNDVQRYSLSFDGGSVVLDADVPLIEGPSEVPEGTLILVMVVLSNDIPNKVERHKPLWKNRQVSRWWRGVALQPCRLEDGAFERIGHVSGRVDKLANTKSIRVKIV
ncbi:uncharacterized protein Z520_00704 [Fonsecaea multimorphosa CBS 102226]|uniref:Heterokaryon incompatibility domain-containing protein n=1 Tax=Fonsecaea multimorphosa CBS 102226 TaxID=1442371 RepID=A0A0D2J3Q4_9EURO|nr:uncharacterized protein Z520_00704 [Fonsecaea multimorphosa CBS 102226]KIY04012.1 hypothetical protein Z520_00704 [Fonsecaea multimorphosa CBS 102226]OAL31848.1 hypothetical protein AYO22_00718 [Fonsecaea multimorphosa]